MPAERIAWGQTLFCDDLRNEVGGKTSLMGIYQSELIIDAEFPVLLPKLVISVTYYEIAGRMNGPLNLRVYMPHDNEAPSLSFDIPRVESERAWVPPPDPDSEKIITVQAPIILSPFEIRSEGSLKVRMQCGDLVTRLGRLHIRRPVESEIKLYASANSAQPIAQPAEPQR